MKIKARQGYGYTEYAEKCDNCGEQSKAVHEDFGELNSLNRANGWKIVITEGQWKGYCPRCDKEEVNA